MRALIFAHGTSHKVPSGMVSQSRGGEWVAVLGAAVSLGRTWAHLQHVVEADLDLGHPREEGLHRHLAVHIAAQHGALAVHQHVHLL
jgi:hypothetical protein